jgi:hypothetical protein
MKYLIAICALAVFAMAGAVAFRGPTRAPASSVDSEGNPGGNRVANRIALISHGESVELEPHLLGPGYVIVSFGAEW